MEDLIRIKPFHTGCYDENGDKIEGVDTGKYIPSGVRYKHYKGSETYPNYWRFEDSIIYDEDMQRLISDGHFKPISQITLVEMDKLQKRGWFSNF